MQLMKPWINEDLSSVSQWPRFTSKAEEAVLKILRDGDVSTHPVIHELENDYAAFTDRKYCVAHNNGTSALMAAFNALNLEAGDEVLVPTATFWASVLPMVWNGLVPVFCESESDTLGICPDDMRKKITDKTKAVVIVHLWGLPCKMKEIRELCDEFNLKIIEDASHAHGASWHGEKCGNLGDISVLSLQGDKLAPAGEGGFLLTDDYDYWERVICFGDITRIIQLESPQYRFAATSMGIKTRIAPLSAALGRVTLEELEENNSLRNKSHLFLSRKLEALGFDCFLPEAGVERVYFEFLIRHRSESFDVEKFINILQEHKVEVGRPRYPLLHQQPFFNEVSMTNIGRYPSSVQIPKYAEQSFPITERENMRMIKLPNFCSYNEVLLEEYAKAFERALECIS